MKKEFIIDSFLFIELQKPYYGLGGRRSEGGNKRRVSSRSGGDRPDRNSGSDRKPSGFGRKRRER